MNKSSQITSSLILLLLLLIPPSTGATYAPEGPVQPQSPTFEMLQQLNSGQLVNGDFDLGVFYWRPTNHYVAWPWFEWWGNFMTIPEFIDGGHPHHNVCYPVPLAGQSCFVNTTGTENHSQGYIRYGATYIAGIYQPVSGVTPCTLYKFEMYNRNDAWNYHPKVGIDPTGWQITNLGNSGPDNCPPDGQSRCPDPYIGAFPGTMIWSPEFDHAPYTWARGSVTAEAVGDTISVWTYAAPEVAGSMSTYWDAGTLTQVPFPNGKLPNPGTWTPSGFVYDVSAVTGTTTLTITWKTQAPASTQVRYEIVPYQPPISSTILISLSERTYLPIVAKGPNPTNFTRYTVLNTAPTTQHQAVITGIQPNDTVMFVPLSRRPLNTACTTETYTPIVVRFDAP